MRAISRATFVAAPVFGGVLLLLCALAFYYLAVIRIDYRKTILLDLDPHTDAIEYFAQAKALLQDGRPFIQIGYEKLPSRFPFGYPALMLPWLKILPAVDAILAPFRTNQTLGVLLLLAVFVFYTYLAMPLTGGLATLLLVTLPGFFTFCRSSISEISASLLIVLAFMFAYLGLSEERRWKIYLSAILLGLSVNIRIASFFFAPLLLAMALFPLRGVRWRWLLHCSAIPIVFVIAVSPVLVLNYIQLQSPFKTGYDFWVSNELLIISMRNIDNLYLGNGLFSLYYVPPNALTLWKEFTLQPYGYDTAHLFGTGTVFVPAFLLLTCAGLVFIRGNRFVACAFSAGLTYAAAMLGYLFGRDGRFYLPLLILLVAVAVLPVNWAARNLFAGRRLTALAIFVLFAGACLGYPSRSGYNTRDIGRSQAWDALHFADPPRPSIQFAAQRDFATLLKRQPGIVLSDIDPVYLNALLPRWFIAAPIDGNHHYKLSSTWRYDKPRAIALVEHGLQQSLPVYALFVSREEVARNQARLPNVPGYEWRTLNNSHGNVAILKLTAVGSGQTAPVPE